MAYCRHELNQSSGEKDRNPIYKHNQRLEELRNLQDRLTQEREQWQREKENQQKELDEREKQLLKLQVSNYGAYLLDTFQHRWMRMLLGWIYNIFFILFHRRTLRFYLIKFL